MADLPVVFHRLAVEEAEAAYAWYADQNSAAGELFLIDLDMSVPHASECGWRDTVPANPLSYSEFGRLRLRGFLPTATAIVEQGNFEWMNGAWWYEGIGFTWFGRLMGSRDDTAGLEILFEELDLKTVKQILDFIGLPVCPGMRDADLQVIFGPPQAKAIFTADRRTYYFRVGSSEAYQVGCTVHDDFGLIHISVIRSDIRRTLALAAAQTWTIDHNHSTATSGRPPLTSKDG